MNIVTIASTLSKVAKIKKVDDNEYEIVTEAKIDSRTPIKMYLRKTGNDIFIKVFRC